jgi:hypothetical protein
VIGLNGVHTLPYRAPADSLQVISLVDRVWRSEGLRLWLRPYAIACVGHEAGLVECITDARSVDEIKKRTPGYTSMQVLGITHSL